MVGVAGPRPAERPVWRPEARRGPPTSREGKSPRRKSGLRAEHLRLVPRGGKLGLGRAGRPHLLMPRLGPLISNKRTRRWWFRLPCLAPRWPATQQHLSPLQRQRRRYWRPQERRLSRQRRQQQPWRQRQPWVRICLAPELPRSRHQIRMTRTQWLGEARSHNRGQGSSTGLQPLSRSLRPLELSPHRQCHPTQAGRRGRLLPHRHQNNQGTSLGSLLRGLGRSLGSDPERQGWRLTRCSG